MGSVQNKQSTSKRYFFRLLNVDVGVAPDLDKKNLAMPAMGVFRFGSGPDELTGTKGVDVFVATKKSSKFADVDVITNYQSKDAVDLPGVWGRRGSVTLKGSLFNADFNDSLSSLIAENLNVGEAGIFGLSGGGWGRSTVLFYNLGGKGVDGKDVMVVLAGYGGGVTVV